jgi:superfamily II DNA/RNA helicase
MENNQNITLILKKLGVKNLNPMQMAANKAILNEKDVFILSPTGSGKTIAFLLPVFELLSKETSGVQCHGLQNKCLLWWA